MTEIREAQAADYPFIAKLHAESWRQNYRGIYSNTFLDHEVEQNRSEIWRKRLHSPAKNQHLFVASHQDHIIGFACLILDEDPGFGSLLDNLHVSSDFQKTGIGKRLLKECARRITEKASSKKMYLWVYEANENARKVYERLGGAHVEIVEKLTEDGTRAPVCRYSWPDIAVLL